MEVVYLKLLNFSGRTRRDFLIATLSHSTVRTVIKIAKYINIVCNCQNNEMSGTQCANILAIKI